MGEVEEWREVPGYPGIWASSWGRVHRRGRDGLKPTGQRAKPTFGTLTRQVSSSGVVYEKRSVRWRGYRILLVSRLVCSAWYGVPPAGAVALHADDDPLNNVPSNLRWGTQAENLAAASFRAKRKAISARMYRDGLTKLAPGGPGRRKCAPEQEAQQAA
ncbi:MAG TPA: HNH endonuclease signature motif containing protein [Amaricoccus sp.]|uniref:HNH endonuclease signature motif containing protein n=1 Tax=Amaricoccus sp. TaxID=1872485 RepID=UPI002CF38B60|nr:HNH endonuclease signature motif containing protein [Amaricoccus sp.]HMQ92488.1 HNH endonuclease signature motif containing protein [Amaricoccus sp.]HMR53863.1 HNH endonuclease signature motif containing protein [Amaricoccus sp.]HMR58980.1 HNH endonuclease signature motif containing protein [Amaricoccus sp.]HMU00858.1 HNH endonuclease signature motif containing protein [Amaricoccus sp.]